MLYSVLARDTERERSAVLYSVLSRVYTRDTEREGEVSCVV